MDRLCRVLCINLFLIIHSLFCIMIYIYSRYMSRMLFFAPNVDYTEIFKKTFLASEIVQNIYDFSTPQTRCFWEINWMCKILILWYLPSRNESKIVSVKHSSISNRMDTGILGQDCTQAFFVYDYWIEKGILSQHLFFQINPACSIYFLTIPLNIYVLISFGIV